MTGEIRSGLAGRVAVVGALVGLAVAQPVLGIFGDNPEFFVSGGYSNGQVWLFAIAVAVVPTAAACGALLVASRLGRAAESAMYSALVGLFSMAIASRFLLALGVSVSLLVVLAAAAAGVVLVVADRRFPGVHLFLSYLVVGNVIYLGLFAFGSRTAALLGDDGESLPAGPSVLADAESPVVVVILDEFPLVTMLGADGTINESRFPNFARLARTSTWFRNTSARTAATPTAVPEILTGRATSTGALPTHQDHPRNLFTMLGPHRETHSLEVATALCPDEYCGEVATPPIRHAFEDAAIVYGHKVLPPVLSGKLPAIDKSYGGFVERTVEDDSAAPGVAEVVDPYDVWRSRSLSERSGAAQRSAFREIVATIEPSPALHMIHVALPHAPWGLTPYDDHRNSVIPREDSPGDPDHDSRFLLRYQMHVMQAGATDVLVGELLDHLAAEEMFEETLLVVTSDHGVSFTRPDTGRGLTRDNAEDLLRVPLFVKAVGQSTGVVDDSPAQTIDILPSIADLLGIEIEWTFDGHSLYDGSAPGSDRLVEDSVGPLLDLARERATWVGEDGWRGLADVGPHGNLVGREVELDLLGVDGDRSFRFAQQGQFDSLPVSGKNPYIVSGVVTSPQRPESLLVVINDTVAGVLDGFFEVDDGWYFYGLVTDEYREGANEVTVVAVTEDGELRRLRRQE